MRPPDQPETDASLVERARRGDERAFERLYRAHIGRVIALCARLAGDRSRAEEMAQDVFVRVWERLAQFRGESAFTSWLHRLTVNFVLDEHRTEGRRVARVVAVEGLERIEQGVAVAAGEVAAVRVPTRTQGGYRIPREVAATEVDASLRALAQRGG